jgi:carboxypeptidase C (cathepsin A)
MPGRFWVRLGEAGPSATMFYIGYCKEGAEATARPITFVFNGGPGRVVTLGWRG